MRDFFKELEIMSKKFAQLACREPLFLFSLQGAMIGHQKLTFGLSAQWLGRA
jgi:hypothetical protein